MRRHNLRAELARILGGEQAFGNSQVQQARQHQGGQRDQQGQRLVAKHYLQAPVVMVDHLVKTALHGGRPTTRVGARVLGLQPACRHHGHQGQRHHGRYQNRQRQGHRKLAEQAAHDVAHKQQRDQHRNQRYRERDDGEANLRRTFKRRRHGRLALFYVAGDVLDHHDRIVHHKARRNGQRHQAQVVEAIAQ